MGIAANVKNWVKDKGKEQAFGTRLPNAYRAAASKPIEMRKVLFVETNATEMPESFFSLFAHFAADPSFDPVFISLRRRDGVQAYLANCMELAREAATARCIFLDDASDVISCLPIRPETRVVQLWHACGAFKKWGYSTLDAGFGATRAQREKYPNYRNLSLVTVSSPEVIWAYEQAMDLEGQGVVEALGVPRTDVFFNEEFLACARQRMHEVLPETTGKTLVLYAPTYRGAHLELAEAPQTLDLAAVGAALPDTCALLVKQHPAVAAAELAYGASPYIYDVSGLPISDLLAAADVLVTDYSSVFFEFSLMGKPIVFYAPDLDAYELERGFFYDYRSLVPGPIATDAAELAARIAHAEDEFDQARVEAFRERFMSACDGQATSRVVQAALGTDGGRA